MCSLGGDYEVADGKLGMKISTCHSVGVEPQGPGRRVCEVRYPRSASQLL